MNFHNPFTACFLKFKDNTGEHFVLQLKKIGGLLKSFNDISVSTITPVFQEGNRTCRPVTSDV